MAGYNFSSTFTLAQRLRATDLLAWGTRENWSTTDLQTRLQREGLGYRRSVLIKDYERARVISLSSTKEAEQRANDFYERVYQPFKEASGLNTTQMGTIMSARQRGFEVPDELQDAFEEWDNWVETEGS